MESKENDNVLIKLIEEKFNSINIKFDNLEKENKSLKESLEKENKSLKESLEKENKSLKESLEKENKEIKDKLADIETNHLKHIYDDLEEIKLNNAVDRKSLEWNNRLTVGIFLAVLATAIKYFLFP